MNKTLMIERINNAVLKHHSTIMIWDILNRIYLDLKEKTSLVDWVIKEVFEVRTQKEYSIEKQSDECVDFVYNLIR